MLHVRLCTLRRDDPDESLGFDLWRSRKKSNTSDRTEEDCDMLIIKGVARESPAGRGGLREGDKIIAVDGCNVRTAGDVRKLVETAVEVRVMVERWEGPKIPETTERKASDPSAPQRMAQSLQTTRRRSNTLRSIPAVTEVQRWPRNYGLAQNYPAGGHW